MPSTTLAEVASGPEKRATPRAKGPHKKHVFAGNHSASAHPPKHHKSQVSQADADIFDGSAATYGEIHYEGLTAILNDLRARKAPIEPFFDFGSGAGKIVLQAALVENVTAVGVELGDRRHADRLGLITASFDFGSIDTANQKSGLWVLQKPFLFWAF